MWQSDRIAAVSKTTRLLDKSFSLRFVCQVYCIRQQVASGSFVQFIVTRKHGGRLRVEARPVGLPLRERCLRGVAEDRVVPAGHRLHVHIQGNDTSQRRRSYHGIGSG